MLQLGFTIALGRRMACEFVPYDFSFFFGSLAFSMPASSRMRSSGQQKFSDFELDIMTGFVAHGRLGWSQLKTSGFLGLGYAFTQGMAGWRQQRALFACF